MRHERPGRAHVAGLFLAVLMALVCLPVILTGSLRSRPAYDALNYHEKAIRHFAQELPSPDTRDYLSATTPGYHLAIAAASRAALGNDLHGAYTDNLTPTPPSSAIRWQRVFMSLCGLLFTMGLVFTLGWWCSKRFATDRWERSPTTVSIACVLPWIGSPYVFQSGAWLLPDNAAWWGVLIVMLFALRPRASFLNIGVMCVALLLLVCTRQIHAWAAGLIWAASWLAGSMASTESRARVRGSDSGPLLAITDLVPAGARLGAWTGWMALGLLAAVPAFAALWYFMNTWGGLVPPTFKDWYRPTAQLGTAAFDLALIAIYGIFFAGHLIEDFGRAWRNHRAWVVAAMILGVLLAALTPTSFDHAEGRFGGIWQVFNFGGHGNVGNANLFIIILAPIGAAWVVGCLAAFDRRSAWVMLAALAGFIAAQSASSQLWQRYHEPFLLIWLAVACAISASDRRDEPAQSSGFLHGWRLAGPALLAAILGVQSAIIYFKDDAKFDKQYSPGHIETPPQFTQS